MHLDGALEPPVMRELDIGIAAADMGDDDGVLGLRLSAANRSFAV